MALRFWVSVKRSSQLTHNCDGSLSLFTEELCLTANLGTADEEGGKGWLNGYFKLMLVYIHLLSRLIMMAKVRAGFASGTCLPFRRYLRGIRF
jgi:hypothetical protein